MDTFRLQQWLHSTSVCTPSGKSILTPRGTLNTIAFLPSLGGMDGGKLKQFALLVMAGFRPGADSVMVWLKALSIFGILLICCSCAGKKGPSAGLIRKQIEDLGLGTIEKDYLQIRQVSMAQKNQVIVETNLPLSMQVSRGKGKDWQIKSVRLGDRNWVDIDLFMEVFNGIRTRQTQEMLDKLADALVLYRAKTKGNAPL